MKGMIERSIDMMQLFNNIIIYKYLGIVIIITITIVRAPSNSEDRHL